MTKMTDVPSKGARVHHPRLGPGTVMFSDGAAGTAVVRFESGIEECRLDELETRTALEGRLISAQPDDANTVIVRCQAEAIHSVNQTWGVFAPSRIQLLPHQLWVCKKVLERWPTRWLIADDVGLGKTIEAGLVIWPLIARGAVKRMLILCPASLVQQWQQRMREMFDIRLHEYTSSLDRNDSDYWQSHPYVVASLHTVRSMSTEQARARRRRLVEADAWDLVIVDEAHHLNVEDQGETQGYRLLKELEENGRIVSMLFFTATPHRGKHRGFFSLMQLLRGDLFDASKPIEPQLPRLSEAAIRNNKQRVTDLHGRRLFKPPRVRVQEFAYSDAERAFYGLLTEFIVSGRAYASGLGTAGQQVSLVLTALQKLAASSVAAIRRAVRRRLERLRRELDGHRERQAKQPQILLEEDDFDRLAALEEELAEAGLGFRLVEHEIPALEELLAAADAVEVETKLQTLLALLDGDLRNRTVLMFTEYKATQALVVSALRQRFGRDSVSFINGDHELTDVDDGGGRKISLRVDRKQVAADFNRGAIRFLVSTEAAGEGIDLQGNCHTLIHLDVPWNPMRIHQRNGRLYRYGQEHQVEVVTLRNPDTVEARIWDLLSERMQEIEKALVEVMDDPEDLTALVLGMAKPRAVESVFERGAQQRPDRLDTWFQAETASFAGRDAVETVKQLFGSVARFDFQEVADQVPRVDLPDLEPFMKRAMGVLGRRMVAEADGTFSLAAPEELRNTPGIRRKYERLSFDRHARDGSTVLSAGHRLVIATLDWARGKDASYAVVGGTSEAFAVVTVQDRVTTNTAQVQMVVLGVALDPQSGAPTRVLRDWEMLRDLGAATAPRSAEANSNASILNLEAVREAVLVAAPQFQLPFEKPIAEVIAVLWPTSAARA